MYWHISTTPVRLGRTIFQFEIVFRDLDPDGLLFKDNLCRGNKQTQLSKAHRAADARAKLSRLAHLKKIGVK